VAATGCGRVPVSNPNLKKSRHGLSSGVVSGVAAPLTVLLIR
jgi:hypothetical protein